MREAKALDFGDLLLWPLRLMRRHPLIRSAYKGRWRYILVDEFQDTNRVQYDLLKEALNAIRIHRGEAPVARIDGAFAHLFRVVVVPERRGEHQVLKRRTDVMLLDDDFSLHGSGSVSD